MILKNKNKFRPIYKKFIKLRENLQNREKILRLKKKKWEKFIQNYKKQLKWYRKVKPKDQTLYLLTRHPGTVFSYKKLYKNIIQENKKFKLIYGGLPSKKIKIILNKKHKIINSITLLKLFESRLDVTLFRANFGNNIRLIRQLIYHNKVLINNNIVKIKSFLIKPGDIIKIKSSYSKFINTLSIKSTWPLYPKHLIINYKIMQIIFNSLNCENFSLNIFYHLNLDKILKRFYKN